MMKKLLMLGLATSAFLAGCSSGAPEFVAVVNDPLGEPEPEKRSKPSVRVVQNSASTQGLDDLEFDAKTGLLKINIEGDTVPIDRLGWADHARFLAYRDATHEYNAYVAGGSGSEVIVYSGGPIGDMQQRASFKRRGTTALPLTGNADYAGSYAGFTTTRRINGDAAVRVDFEDNSLTGRISNRVFRQRSDNKGDLVNPLSDILLEKAVLSASGAFTGRTSGGEITRGQDLWNPAVGRYRGLLGGAKGQEAVGTIHLVHRSPTGGTQEEVGGFYTEKQ